MRALAIAVLLAGCADEVHAVQPAPTGSAANVLARLEASRDLDGAVVGHATAPTLVVVLASWCEHCKAELPELDAVRTRARVVAVNYRGHEEYDHRGNSDAIRAFAHATPWLRVVPIGDDLFDAFGRPALIPTIYVFDRAGTLVQTYDRRQRTMPGRDELAALLARLGA